MMSLLLAPLPMLVTVLLLVIAVLPWGGPDWVEMALLLMPIGAIYFWSLRRPHLMPAVAAFLCGLGLDVMTHGPLGVWACAAVTVAWTGRMGRRARPGLGWIRGGAHMALAYALAGGIVAALMSLSAWRMVPGLPLAQAVVATCLAYPLLAGLLAMLDAAWPAREGPSLFSRGD